MYDKVTKKRFNGGVEASMVCHVLCDAEGVFAMRAHQKSCARALSLIGALLLWRINQLISLHAQQTGACGVRKSLSPYVSGNEKLCVLQTNQLPSTAGEAPRRTFEDHRRSGRPASSHASEALH